MIRLDDLSDRSACSWSRIVELGVSWLLGYFANSLHDIWQEVFGVPWSPRIASNVFPHLLFHDALEDRSSGRLWQRS